MSNLLNTLFKKDPVAFMKRYALVYNVPLEFRSLTNLAYFDIDDGEGPVTIGLAPAEQRVTLNAIHAYYLPYGDNQAFSIQLAAAADYMFTPTLTGCTFATSNKWWNPRVAHLNYQFSDQDERLNALNVAGSINQPRINTGIQNTFGQGATVYQVTKVDYIAPTDAPLEVRLMVVGVRGFWGWYFYRTRIRAVGLGEFAIDRGQGALRIN